MKKQSKTVSIRDAVQHRLANLRRAGIEPRFSMAVALECAVKRSAEVKCG